jgi:ubiquinone/menaquinone biosynthesis C-methylase UbiE
MKNPGYKTTVRFYRMRFWKKLARFNRESELPDYFGPMIGDKKEVNIAELGAGPICTIGNLWKDVKVNLYASDILKNEYDALWAEHNATPIIPIEYQDMENLTYSDNFFDIVHCVNALDHTLDAKKALKEMIRVCKPGGWIYLRHLPDQKKACRGMHAWDIHLVNGEMALSNSKEQFLLSEFGDFKTHMEKHLIVSILHKT